MDQKLNHYIALIVVPLLCLASCSPKTSGSSGDDDVNDTTSGGEIAIEPTESPKEKDTPTATVTDTTSDAGSGSGAPEAPAIAVGTVAILPDAGLASGGLSLTAVSTLPEEKRTVRIEAQKALRLVNPILCTAASTAFGQRLDQGPYVAKILLSRCFPNSNTLEDVDNAPADVVVTATKGAGDQATVKFWLTLPASYLAIEAVPTAQPMMIPGGFLDLYATLTVNRGPDLQNPLGLFDLAFEAWSDTTLVWQGAMTTSPAADANDVELRLYEKADASFAENMNSWTAHLENSVAYVLSRAAASDTPTFTGRGRSSQQITWEALGGTVMPTPAVQSEDMGSTTANFAFTANRFASHQFFLRPDMPPGDTTDVCKSRGDEFANVKRYALMNATGETLDFQSTYPLIDPVSGATVGWVNYERAKVPDGTPDGTDFVALLRDGSRIAVKFRATDGLLYKTSSNSGIASRDVTPVLTSNLTLTCDTGCPGAATELTFSVETRRLMDGASPVSVTSDITFAGGYRYVPQAVTSNALGVFEILEDGTPTGTLLSAPPPIEFVDQTFNNVTDAYPGTADPNVDGDLLSALGIQPFFDGFSFRSLFMTRTVSGVGVNLPSVVFSSQATLTSATDAPPLIQAGDQLRFAPLTTDLLPRDAGDCSSALLTSVTGVAADANFALPTTDALPATGAKALLGAKPSTMTGQPIVGDL